MCSSKGDCIGTSSVSAPAASRTVTVSSDALSARVAHSRAEDPSRATEFTCALACKSSWQTRWSPLCAAHMSGDHAEPPLSADESGGQRAFKSDLTTLGERIATANPNGDRPLTSALQIPLEPSGERKPSAAVRWIAARSTSFCSTKLSMEGTMRRKWLQTPVLASATMELLSHAARNGEAIVRKRSASSGPSAGKIKCATSAMTLSATTVWGVIDEHPDGSAI
mmetsp:Transcript_55990/g.131024  ORF Transcript_55990/g.131024 Transcript_55990/m.131024 type:complete len:224 (+) Transcript_55990:216-887(+)